MITIAVVLAWFVPPAILGLVSIGLGAGFHHGFNIGLWVNLAVFTLALVIQGIEWAFNQLENK